MHTASFFFARIGAGFVLVGTPFSPLLAGHTIEPAPAAKAEQAPELTAIDYTVLYRRMMQLGMLSQQLGYTLTVDGDGKAVACSFSRRFKSPYTSKELCKAFIRTTQFKPARDGQGNAVIGLYEGEVEIASFFQPNR